MAAANTARAKHCNEQLHPSNVQPLVRSHLDKSNSMMNMTMQAKDIKKMTTRTELKNTILNLK